MCSKPWTSIVYGICAGQPALLPLVVVVVVPEVPPVEPHEVGRGDVRARAAVGVRAAVGTGGVVHAG